MADTRDFLIGLTKGLSADLEQRRKDRLELAMISKRIELEQATRRVPQEEFGQVLGGLGFPEEQAQQLGQIQSVPGQQALIQAGRPLQAIQARGKAFPRRARTIFQDIEGRKVAITLDETGNITNQRELGLSSTFAKETQDAVANLNSANSQLDVIEDLASELITARGPFSLLGQAASVKIGAFARTNPTARAFLDEKQAFLSMLTRAAGEKGVLTTQDVERIAKALPSEFDTVQTFELKMKVARSLFKNIAEGRIQAFSGRKAEQKSVLPKKQKGLFSETDLDAELKRRGLK